MSMPGDNPVPVAVATVDAPPVLAPPVIGEADQRPGLWAWFMGLHWRRWLRSLPAWGTSAALHAALLVALGLWMLPELRANLHELIATTFDDGLDEPLDDSQAETLDNVQLQTDANELSLPMAVETQTETPALATIEEPTTELGTKIDELGADALAPTDLGGLGALVAGGFEGRGDEARKLLVAQRGGNTQSEASVAASLNWFMEHQNDDGSWSFDHAGGRCQGRCRNAGILRNGTLGATAMALLPFLGAGHTHRRGKFKQQIEAGLDYLVSQMQETGDGGALVDGGRLYSHGLATIALCEAYAMTKDRALAGPAQQAVDFIVWAQDPSGGGWRYAPRQRGDTSVVGWQLMALKSASMGRLRVPGETVHGVDRFLDSVAADGGAAYGYLDAGSAPTTSAIGLLLRMYLGWQRDNPALLRGAQRIAAEGPIDGNVYHNYYATQVLHHFDGGLWDDWNRKLRDHYVATQASAGHEAGSWFFAKHDHGSEPGGRLYCTSMVCMTLEVYYRHLPLYREETTEEDFE